MRADLKEDKNSRMLHQLIEAHADMEAKIDQRIDARLMATLQTFFSTHGNQNLLGAASAGPQAGEHHSTTSMTHE